MGLEIIINVAREETRVAVLDRKILSDLYIDRVKQRDFVGNVYKGKVVKVLPGLQAAFIDIGQDKAAFMHVSELTGGSARRRRCWRRMRNPPTSPNSSVTARSPSRTSWMRARSSWSRSPRDRSAPRVRG